MKTGFMHSGAGLVGIMKRMLGSTVCIVHCASVPCAMHCASCIVRCIGALVLCAWCIALQKTAEHDVPGEHREEHHEEHQDECRVHA